MDTLTQMKCVACRGGDPTLTDAEIAEFHPQVPAWRIVDAVGANAWNRSSNSRILLKP